MLIAPEIVLVHSYQVVFVYFINYMFMILKLIGLDENVIPYIFINTYDD